MELSVLSTNIQELLKAFHDVKIEYVSSSSIKILNKSACMSNAGTDAILYNTDTTISINTMGINGIAQSANLTGTATFTNASSTVTGSGTSFTTDFIVGDVISSNGGQSRRITVITSNTSLTVESNFSSTESGVAFKRGGKAPNTTYYLYACKGTSGVGGLLSTRDVSNGETLVDTVTNYNASTRQINVNGIANEPLLVYLNSSSNIDYIGGSFIWVIGGNGSGSTNTNIRRYLTIAANLGKTITYTDSSTLGASFTINKTGVYAIAGSLSTHGTISLNEATNRAYGSINSWNSNSTFLISATSASLDDAGISVQHHLKKGDMIRAHTYSSRALEHLKITRVG